MTAYHTTLKIARIAVLSIALGLVIASVVLAGYGFFQ